MHSKRILISCPVGDPFYPQTWSGVPKKLVDEFLKQAIEVTGCDSSIPPLKNYYLKLLNKTIGYGPDYSKTILARKVRAAILKKYVALNPVKNILHIGDLSLPCKNLSDVNHFLYTDFTFDLWRKYTGPLFNHPEKWYTHVLNAEKKGFAQVSHFFVMAQHVKTNLQSVYSIPENKITVVNVGRGNIEPFYGEKDYGNHTILIVTKNRFEQKGGSLLLDGFKKAYLQNNKLRLIVVGGERDKEIIGNTDGVHITGYLPWEELQQLYNKASLYAMPAHNEPWGIVFTEALSCKIPVLGLKRNAIPEITNNGEFGFMVEQPDSDHIAETILKAFKNPDLLKTMGEKGQVHVINNYSWENTVAKMNKVIFG